ncbi:hypothetical protein BDR04DRAFT_1091228 [Suillus decipiens]|nr:hypothetical protein BDR04DRAFT_1091228 [Suillus decipiens]
MSLNYILLLLLHSLVTTTSRAAWFTAKKRSSLTNPVVELKYDSVTRLTYPSSKTSCSAPTREEWHSG